MGRSRDKKPASVALGGSARAGSSRFWSTAGVGDQGSRRGTRLQQSDVQRKTCTKRGFKGEAHGGPETDLRARTALRRVMVPRRIWAAVASHALPNSLLGNT